MDQRKKIIIFSSIFLVLSLIMVVLAIFFGNRQNATQSQTEVNQNSYYDANSGETVLNPDNRQPESIGNQSILILGLPTLLDYGISSGQIDLLKTKINTYSSGNKINNEAITEVSFSKNNISQSIDKTSNEKTLSVKIVINQKYNYKIELHYLWDRDITIKIFDTDSNLIFTD